MKIIEIHSDLNGECKLPYWEERVSMTYYLYITGEGIIGFMPFSRVLAKCEM